MQFAHSPSPRISSSFERPALAKNYDRFLTAVFNTYGWERTGVSASHDCVNLLRETEVTVLIMNKDYHNFSTPAIR